MLRDLAKVRKSRTRLTCPWVAASIDLVRAFELAAASIR